MVAWVRRSLRLNTLLASCGVALALAGAAASLEAQPSTGPRLERPAPGETQELELRDGSRLYGRVESVDEEAVVFTTISGARMTVARADIVSLHKARGRIDETSRFIPADPNATRLFFGPTARGLPAGHGYVGVYEFLLPFVQFGATDWLSLGGGTPLVFGGGGAHPFWFTPKLQVYRGSQAQAAVGVIHFVGIDDDEGGGLGIAYGVATFGTPDRSLTLGAGWGYTRLDDDAGNAAIAMVGGEYRVRRNLKLITENYVFSGGGILCAGVRFIGDHLSADLGLAAPIGVDALIVAPMVNFMWTFGSDR